jgi:hypothetical protein
MLRGTLQSASSLLAKNGPEAISPDQSVPAMELEFDRDRKMQEIREPRIKRFQQRQRTSHEWMCFADIADWCARVGGDIKPDEERRSIALSELARSLENGEFEKLGRCRVLFLSAASSMAKMTMERWRFIAARKFDNETLRSAYLAHCWIPRTLCISWFEARRLGLPPWLKNSGPLAAAHSDSDRLHVQESSSPSPAPMNTPNLDALPLWLTAMQALAWTCTRKVGPVWRADLERALALQLLALAGPARQHGFSRRQKGITPARQGGGGHAERAGYRLEILTAAAAAPPWSCAAATSVRPGRAQRRRSLALARQRPAALS